MAGNFNGASSYVDLGATSTTRNKTALSMSFWTLMRTFRDADSWMSYSTGTNTGAVRFGVKIIGTAGNQARPQIRARATDAEALKTFDAGSGTPLVGGSWTHIAAACDYGSSIGLIYINGVLSAQGSFSAAFAAGTTSNTVSLTAAVGASEAGTVQFLDGAVADPRLYDRILGAGEVSTIFTAKGKDNIIQGLQDRFYIEGPPGVVITAVPNLGASKAPGSPTSNPTYLSDTLSMNRKVTATGRVW